MAFRWDDLLEDIGRYRKVVAVVGPELFGVTDPGGAVPFYEELAARTAEILRASGKEDLPAGAGWAQLVAAVSRRRDLKYIIGGALDEAHTELLAAKGPAELPEPLRLLAEITDFPLVLTTTIDGLVGKAFRVPRGTEFKMSVGQNVDIPADWMPPPLGAPPALVHLFGLIKGSYPEYALTEEDTLEFMCNLQNNAPKQLISRLGKSDVLILGTHFPDWLARFFLRSMRGRPLSDLVTGASRQDVFQAYLSEAQARQPWPLVTFLKTYSEATTRIYEEGSPADFVRELNSRWKSARPDVEPMPMPQGAIFVSYASEDRAAAQAVTQALEKGKLEVWFDRSDERDKGLQVGDPWFLKIKGNIEKCHLFVPLLSRATLTKTPRFFRQEWEFARDHHGKISPTCPFMAPIIIDDVNVSDLTDFKYYFELGGSRHVQALRAPGGVLDDAKVRMFINLIKEVRAPQSTGAAAAS